MTSADEQIAEAAELLTRRRSSGEISMLKGLRGAHREVGEVVISAREQCAHVLAMYSFRLVAIQGTFNSNQIIMYQCEPPSGAGSFPITFSLHGNTVQAHTGAGFLGECSMGQLDEEQVKRWFAAYMRIMAER